VFPAEPCFHTQGDDKQLEDMPGTGWGHRENIARMLADQKGLGTQNPRKPPNKRTKGTRCSRKAFDYLGCRIMVAL